MLTAVLTWNFTLKENSSSRTRKPLEGVPHSRKLSAHSPDVFPFTLHPIEILLNT